MRVVYVDFVGNGGMLHYAESLHTAMASLLNSSLMLPRLQDGPRPSHGSVVDKVTRKYNPLYYRRIADQLMATYNPDLVHITSKSTGLRPFIARLRGQGVPVIYTLHDPTPHSEHMTLWGALAEQYYRAYETPWILRNCDAIHLHSTFQIHELQQRYDIHGDMRAYVVSHGGGATEKVLLGSETPHELEIGRGRFSFLFFGRIEPYKGVTVLLDAFEQLLKIQPDCRLIVAGDGHFDPRPSLPSAAVVVLNRFIKDSEVRAIFQASQAIVLPYLSATQSGVIPLAYSFSRPVICSNVGGLPDMVAEGRTGLMVPAGQVGALAQAMITMARNESDARTMGERGRSYMHEHFSWGAIAEQHKVQYAKLVSGRRLQSNQARDIQAHAG